ncbi:Bacteriophage tail assembly protein [Hartmannibacter diazotrophicus]|uniref:Bacteriophage tail assembly protein n=1 Tax=Hartmannibacter diazotrophicus TaxID=1482074 RepID=A0A2C9D2D9_9HYPH|nr:terminase gpA endonuclease subunit [Hartmannibacter diazotrophicus]SON54328.1 Bacteriophage tail assembly protein [Hartmannibacter diazotrophicus]
MKLSRPHEFATLEEIVIAASEMVRPPERITVSEAATKYRYLDNPGSYVGYWKNEKTPYLVEVMDTLTSLDFRGVVLAGAARIGKTDIFYNWLTHTAICDPADMMFIGMTKEVSRDISQGDLGKVFRNTKELGSRLIPGRHSDNVFDKRFKSGMRLLLRWPSITELSGKTIPRLCLADYDRMEDDIASEGPAFDLAMKRSETFKRFGMTFAESSPGREIRDPKWIRKTPHEAPPVHGGILSLYNRGDRRRWNWRCPYCDNPFEPHFGLLKYPKSADNWEAAQMVTMQCPHCRMDIDPSFKRELNSKGRWIREGMLWLPDGSIVGQPIRTDIASFWLKGPAAAFQDWQSLVFAYLQAVDVYENTGDENPLKKTVTADQGEAYLPKALAESRSSENLMEHAEDWGTTKENPTVPPGVRFIIATVDVQSGSRSGFVVQVTGFGLHNDAWVIDMFRLLKSERRDEDDERLPLDPSAYAEDWDLLIGEVIKRSYPLADQSGRRMSIKLTGCDYGGKEGVSIQAREFWRRLHTEHGLSNRFQLVKGDPLKTVPAYTKKFPDANQKDKFTAARGDVPVGFINSNDMKDALNGFLSRQDKGGGYWTFPIWAPKWFYTQMTSEVRTDKGWEKPANHRVHNEAWDLSYYALALLRHEEVRALRAGFWDKPPPWAAEWDKNALVFGEQDENPVMPAKPKKYDLSALAKRLT